MDRHATSQYYGSRADIDNEGWTRVGSGKETRNSRTRTQQPIAQEDPAKRENGVSVVAESKGLVGYDLESGMRIINGNLNRSLIHTDLPCRNTCGVDSYSRDPCKVYGYCSC